MLVTIDFQHAHSMGTNSNKSHSLDKLPMLCNWKSLHKYICYLISSRDVFEFNIPIFNTLSDEVMVDLDVFGASMVSRVDSEGQSPLIVT